MAAQQHYTQNDIRDARRDRDAYLYFKPARDHQMGLAFVAAVNKSPRHPLSEKIGRTLARL